jgi:hypothetical protein
MPEKNWKLKLGYGKTKTPYKHYTAIADGIVVKLIDGFECRSGKAYMGMKTWALSTEESANMIKVIGKEIGFEVTGKIEVYSSEAVQPPNENPYGYDIKFTPYN